MYQLLSANCAINGHRNIRCFHAAASDRRHSARLFPISYSEENNFGSLGIDAESVRPSGSAEGEPVQAICLDEIVDEACNGRRVAFVKIDVQSFELFSLRGLLRTLTRDRPALFLEISPYWMRRSGYDYREIYRLLRTLNYSIRHTSDIPLGVDGLPTVSVNTDIEWDIVAVPQIDPPLTPNGIGKTSDA
jgi:FkbM family methyltransferase